jgi:hypothetical protein
VHGAPMSSPNLSGPMKKIGDAVQAFVAVGLGELAEAENELGSVLLHGADQWPLIPWSPRNGRLPGRRRTAHYAHQ